MVRGQQAVLDWGGRGQPPLAARADSDAPRQLLGKKGWEGKGVQEG